MQPRCFLALVGLIGSLALSVPSGTAQTLVVSYGFNEGSGATAADGASSPANAALQGAAGWTTNTPGGTGSALDIHSGATTDYASAGTVAKLAGLSQFTITMWVNLQAAPGANDRLLSTLSSGTFKGIDFTIVAPGSGSLSASNFSLGLGVNGVSAGNLTSEATGLNASNQWLFVAVTYDGTASSANTSFYSGGVSTSVGLLDGTAKSISSGAVASSGTGALEIGATQASGSDRTPPAFLDDVRVYGGVLTAAQLNAVRLEAVPEPGTAALLGAFGLLLPLASVFHARRRAGA